jgi:hypothetical protein
MFHCVCAMFLRSLFFVSSFFVTSRKHWLWERSSHGNRMSSCYVIQVKWSNPSLTVSRGADRYRTCISGSSIRRIDRLCYCSIVADSVVMKRQESINPPMWESRERSMSFLTSQSVRQSFNLQVPTFRNRFLLP